MTFDFAQQPELPCHTRELGPLYFKVPCRVQLFGIVQDARIEQCNYLFGWQHTIGPDGKKAHGSNSVVSMLHHHLDTNAADKSLHFHADNCTGQNKNKTVLGYLAWRCVTGLSEQIELSFMRVGHTLSAMDCYFGLIKQWWRSTENYTVENAVEKSSNANRSCHILLEMAAVGCLSASIFKPVKNILKFQLFSVASTNTTSIECRETPDCEPVVFQILRDDVAAPTDRDDLPAELHPTGLSETRQTHLEKEVEYYFTQDAQEHLPRK